MYYSLKLSWFFLKFHEAGALCLVYPMIENSAWQAAVLYGTFLHNIIAITLSRPPMTIVLPNLKDNPFSTQHLG